MQYLTDTTNAHYIAVQLLHVIPSDDCPRRLMAASKLEGFIVPIPHKTIIEGNDPFIFSVFTPPQFSKLFHHYEPQQEPILNDCNGYVVAFGTYGFMALFNGSFTKKIW